MSRAVIIDGSGANLASLRFALERQGCRAKLTVDPDEIRRASHVFLPGVGAAAAAMERLERAELTNVLSELEQPVLGICLGMQLLFDASEEGDAQCLGLMPGTARKFASAPGRPVPHMGWNGIDFAGEEPLLAGIESGAHFYFVHSYALARSESTIATCDYGGPFTAVARSGNRVGVQFHPERSGTAGARLLANFLELEACS